VRGPDRHGLVATGGTRRALAQVLATLALAAGLSGQDAPPTRTLRYESPGASDCWLDLSLPPTPRADAPTVLLVHGGAWKSGARGQLAALSAALLERGFPVVDADYTLSTPERASWPQALLDLKAVVRWIRIVGLVGRWKSGEIQLVTTERSPSSRSSEKVARCSAVRMSVAPPPGRSVTSWRSPATVQANFPGSRGSRSREPWM